MSQGLNNQQERWKVMKIDNLQQIEKQIKLKLPNKEANVIDVESLSLEEGIAKLLDKLKKLEEKIKECNDETKNLDKQVDDIYSDIAEIVKIIAEIENDYNKESTPGKFLGDAEKAVEFHLLTQYDKELKKLKSFVSSYIIASIKDNIQKYFSSILNEAEEDPNPEISAEAEEASYQNFVDTFNTLLKNLENAEKEAVKTTEELHEAKAIRSEPVNDRESEDIISTDSTDVTKVEVRAPDFLVVGDGSTRSCPKNGKA